MADNKDFLLTFRSVNQLKARTMLDMLATLKGASKAEILRDLIVNEFDRLGLELPAEPPQAVQS